MAWSTDNITVGKNGAQLVFKEKGIDATSFINAFRYGQSAKDITFKLCDCEGCQKREGR